VATFCAAFWLTFTLPLTAVARIVVKDWKGVGDEDGKPLPLTPAGIDALLELWPIFEAFQTKYIAGALILDAEKNA
jgi:hypothetical protein